MDARAESTAATAEPQSLVAELQGVPRLALQSVFGKALGGRIWEGARRLGKAQPSPTAASSDGSGPAPTLGFGVKDTEIVAGMIEYVSWRAGERLRERGRQAKWMGVKLVYRDGASMSMGVRLARPRPTHDGEELAAMAVELFERSEARKSGVVAVELRVTSALTERVREGIGGLDCAELSAASI